MLHQTRRVHPGRAIGGHRFQHRTSHTVPYPPRHDLHERSTAAVVRFQCNGIRLSSEDVRQTRVLKTKQAIKLRFQTAAIRDAFLRGYSHPHASIAYPISPRAPPRVRRIQSFIGTKIGHLSVSRDCTIFGLSLLTLLKPMSLAFSRKH